MEQKHIDIMDGYAVLGPSGLDREYNLIGWGGDQLVFRFTDSAQVVKVSHRLLNHPYNVASMKRLLPEVMTDDEAYFKDQIEGELVLYRLREQTLVEVFGEEQIARDTTEVLHIPLTGKVCMQLWGDQVPIGEQEVRWFLTTVRYQEFIPALVDRERYRTLSLGSTYLERKPLLTGEHYESLNQALIEQQGSWTNEEVWQTILALHQGESLGTIEEALADDGFRVVLTDFLQKAKEYTARSGDALDLQPDNVIFYYQDNAWRYKLIDALSPTPQSLVKSAETELLYLPQIRSEELTREQRVVLINTLNYVRTANVLLMRLGLEDRIDFLLYSLKAPGSVFIDWLQLYEALRKPPPQRPLGAHALAVSGLTHGSDKNALQTGAEPL